MTGEAVHPCRSCGAPLATTFVDLGGSPLANAYLSADQLEHPEPYYPMRVLVCDDCFLVQLPRTVEPDAIFADYAYFSSYSDSWVAHARRYVDMAVDRFGLGCDSMVVEIASNDGYLLRGFVERGVPVLGIEPAANVAEVAREAGVRTRVAFFGDELARQLRDEGEAADLIVGNNVLAHVPDLNGFVSGLATLLRAGGSVTMEFPHLLPLIRKTEFDTIYHEHYSYYSLLAVERPFAAAGLQIYDVEELPTHGGSLRIYARHAGSGPVGERIVELRERERAAGLESLETYTRFGEAVRAVKLDLLEFLVQARRDGRRVAAYGAAAKGNTLLNYCGVRPDLVEYVVDRNPHKQGRFLPGSHLPILDPGEVERTRPDYLLILPWNLKDEIVEQMAHVRDFGCRFVVPIPTTTVLP